MQKKRKTQKKRKKILDSQPATTMLSKLFQKWWFLSKLGLKIIAKGLTGNCFDLPSHLRLVLVSLLAVLPSSFSTVLKVLKVVKQVHVCAFLHFYDFFAFLAGAKRTALQVGWSQEAEEEARRHSAENKIEHNLLNFWARSPKFCMQVDLDSP